MPDEEYYLAHTGAEVDGCIDEVTAARGSSASLSAAISAKQDALTFDAAPTENSTNPVTSGGVYASQQAQNTVIGNLANAGAKNLMKNTAASHTLSGVTFTVNADGSVTVTGAATGSTGLRIAGTQGNNTYSVAIPLPKGSYTVYPSNTGNDSIRFGIGIFSDSAATRSVTFIYDSPLEIEVTNSTTRYDFTLAVANGTTCNGETLYPMICRAEEYAVNPDYVPYAPTNRELYEMILAMQAGTASLSRTAELTAQRDAADSTDGEVLI